MVTKVENRVGVNFAIFRNNPWRQFIVLLEICSKDTYIHKNVKNKISDFWLHKAQNVRDCHIFGWYYGKLGFGWSEEQFVLRKTKNETWQ